MSLEPKLGRYFHVFSPDTKEIRKQGKIIKRHRNGWFTIQFLSWVDGAPTTTDDVHIGQMSDGNWAFYDFADDLKQAYDSQAATKREGV